MVLEEKPQPGPAFRAMLFLWVILGLVVLAGGSRSWPWLVVVGVNLYINYQYVAEARGVAYRLDGRILSLRRQGEPELAIPLERVMALEPYPGWLAARRRLQETGARSPVAAIPAYARGRRWLLIYRGKQAPAAISFYPSAELEGAVRAGSKELVRQ